MRADENIKELLAGLLAEEALEYPDYTDNDDIPRKDKIEKLTKILNGKRDIPLIRENTRIIIRQYCYNPVDYNTSDTARGKQRLSEDEDSELFVEETIINKQGVKRTRNKLIIQDKDKKSFIETDNI